MTAFGDRLRTALNGRYALEHELGRGGMATVYLARDQRHNRRVAIKVLKPALAAALGPEQFLREIEVAARLQHPNILPLFDSGEAGGVLYYVMPFVEGESLNDRLARGGKLPIPDSVRILMEVADALNHAHTHGVVHRDIKPGNVLLSGRHALVADFGVAKAVSAATDPELLTSAGVVFGTPAYMAPEQATADQHQDHRVDIYALGALGYHLLTGRTPFAGTTAQEMLAAHVAAVPVPLERYCPAVSPALSQVVLRCLEKKPADRWQTAADVLEQLQPLATPSGGMTPAGTRPGIRRGQLMRWTVVGVAVAAIAFILSWIMHSGAVEITVSDITPVTSEPGVQFQPAVSPDGDAVAYVTGPTGAQRVVIRSTAGTSDGGEIRLADTAFVSETFPRWSGNGESVRFWGCRVKGCAMYETGRLGGAVRSASVPTRLGIKPVQTAWSPDGTRLAFVVADTIFTSVTGDTMAHPVVVGGWFEDFHSLAWSPDGRLLAYVDGNSAWFGGNVMPSSIWIVDPDGGTARPITNADHLNVSPAWIDARHLLFVSNRDGPRGVYVVEVGADGAQGEPRLVPGVADPHSVSYSIAARKLVWAKFTPRQNIWSYPLGRSTPVSIGEGRPVTKGNQVIENHDVSPDGKWLAFDSNLRGNMDIYKMPVAGGEAVRLTESPWDEWVPRWSPDGTEIAYFSGSGAGSTAIAVMPAGGGTPITLTHRDVVDSWPSWSADGLQIYFTSCNGTICRANVLTRDSVGGRWREPVQLTDSWCGYPERAPTRPALLCRNNSRGTVSLVSTQTGRVLVPDFIAAAALARLSLPRYSRDGRTVYAVATHSDGRRGIWAIPSAGGPARLVVAFDDSLLVPTAFVSVGPDRLYLTLSEYESEIWVARLRH